MKEFFFRRKKRKVLNKDEKNKRKEIFFPIDIDDVIMPCHVDKTETKYFFLFSICFPFCFVIFPLFRKFGMSAYIGFSMMTFFSIP